MTLDTNDLRAAFEHDVAGLTHVPDFAQTAAARGRAVQRVRTGAALTAGALAIAAVLGVTQWGWVSHRSTVPAAPKGLAPYSNGMKLVGGRVGGSPLDFDVKLPTSADGKPVDLGLALACAAHVGNGASGLTPLINISINGTPEGSVSGCQKTFPTDEGVTVSWGAGGVSFAPGSTVHVHADLTGKQLPDAQIRVGVYMSVPLDEYVYPPRPATLTPVTKAQETFGVGQGKLLATLGTSKTRIVVTPRHGLVVNTATTQPGLLQVYVNGKLQVSNRSWVYTDDGSSGNVLTLDQLGIAASDPVTVTVVATGFTGDTWRVFVDDAK